ncbi:MAG: response regulator [Opitutaceae bacterium]|jgi:PAS domain S-box-containing protein
MSRPLKVLVVEDVPEDAELLLRQLRKAGFSPEATVVDTEKSFLEALTKPLDIILSDFELPDFSGLRALELSNQSGRKIPFIIVSGSIGEDVAVAAMRQGADDYLLKDRMARLGAAVTHALEQHRLRGESELATQALRDSEERFREVVETINEVFWVTEGWDGRLLYVSPGYERIWGGSRVGLYSGTETWMGCVHAEDKERMSQAMSLRAQTGEFDETYRIIRPDGAVRWIRDRAFPVKDGEGGVKRVVGVAEDVTEHRHLEEQLLRTQRMEAIGTLAGGVAHDLNNILAPTLMAADLLRQKVTDPHGLQLVDMIEQSMRRGAGIIRQMLVFSRGVGGQRTSVQLRHLLEEIETLVRETFPRDITLCLEVEQDLRPVVADATQIHQVLINLCVNARDAMAGGGTLTVRSGNVMLEPEEVRPHSQSRPGWHVLLSVVDTGCGIPQGIQDRIFEPFFTTKAVGKGTGLGLSSVLGIVRSHGGFVTVKSEPGCGATFNVYLPAQGETSEPAAASAGAALPCGHGELVLVVDDEPIIRETTQDLLEGYGYTVLTAAHGEEALELFKQHQNDVRLVLTDLMMPVMGGAELIRRLRALSGDLPMMVSSGLLETDQRRELAALGVSEILAKPYGVKDILEAVSRGLRKN